MKFAKTMAALVTASLTWTLLGAAPATAGPVSAPTERPADPGSGRPEAWHKYVLGPDRTVVRPLGVEPRGTVANPEALLGSDRGIAALTTSQGGAAASVLLDFGREIGGTPYLDVSAATPDARLSLVTGEAKQYLRQPAATTLAAAAAAGSTQVGVRSVNGLEVGHEITLGSDPMLQQATITAVDGAGLTVSFSPALTQPLDAGAAVSSAAGGPASDESPGLAGVGGIDTLVPSAPGRLSGSFHGGFRYVLLTMTGPGTVELSGLRVRFQAYRATPSDYQGWFLSSDELLNKLWYAGAYTNQMNMKPPGLNGLPDARIYDGAKRDRSIWTGDLLVQAPTVLSTLGGPGAAYLRSSFDVMLGQQRADGHIPGSPDFGKRSGPQGRPLYYSNNYSGYGARAIIDYYRYTGDRSYAAKALPALRRELAYNDTFLNQNNLVVSNDRDYWQATQTGEVTKYSIDYYVLLREMAWLERQIGSRSNARAHDAKAKAIKTAVNARLWNPALGAYGQSSEQPNVMVEDANALALQYGFVPDDRVDSVRRALRALWTPYGAIIGPGLADPTGHVIEPFGNGMETAGRFAVDDVTGALELMRRTWGQMLDEDDPLYTGTFWEFKNANGGVNRASASLAHGWAASPTVQLTQYLLGINPVGPGYKTWMVAPHPGSVREASGAVPTKYGKLQVDWVSQKRRHAFTISVRAPKDTRGTISIPFGPGLTASITSNGDTHVFTNAQIQRAVKKGRLNTRVPGGRYLIEVIRH